MAAKPLSIAFAAALALALASYLLINATRSNSAAFASIWFLAALPAFLSAMICYVGDPDNTAASRFYWLTPLALVLVVDLASAAFLGEGVICLIMLSPIWLVAGWIGAFVLRAHRRTGRDETIVRSSLLLLPLLAGVAEGQLVFSHEPVTLERSIIVHATPAEIWPYTLANEHIADTEGRWTAAQNIIGIPRPRSTRLRGEGVGAVRTAFWGDGINFDEIITDWQPGRRLAWNFSFANSSIQDFTDQHLSPDGQFLTVTQGDYILVPLSLSTTRLTLTTHYIAKSHVNWYAKLWGELLLGDVEDNILAILQQRAEAAHRQATVGAAGDQPGVARVAWARP